MVKACEWLVNKYPSKVEIKKIVLEISEVSLLSTSGNLNIGGWPDLEEICFLNMLNPNTGERRGYMDYTEEERMKLGSLVIKNCPQLQKIRTNAIVKIKQINLKNCPQLKDCLITNNDLKKLFIRNCPNINSLNLAGNELTHVNLRRLSELRWLTINGNQLKGLDISQNTKLMGFWCDSSLQPIRTLQQKEEKLVSELKQAKKLLSEAREEVIDHKLKDKERGLESFVQKLGINRKKVRDLSKVYQKLIKAQENFDQNVVVVMEDEIEKIRDELLNGGWFIWKVSSEDVCKLCRECESIAKLKAEQDKLYQERFEARQEMVLYNNRN